MDVIVVAADADAAVAISGAVAAERVQEGLAADAR